MQILSLTNWRRLSLMIMAVMFLGCASGVEVVATREPSSHIRSVLVLPFQNMSRLYGVENNVRSPMTGKVFQTGPVAENAAGWLTAELIAHIREATAFEPVSSSGLGEHVTEMERIRQPGVEALGVVADLGRRFRAEGVFVGYLYRYEDRVGGALGVDKPAAVAFELYLVGVQEGRVLWAGSYDERQKPLTEDLGRMGLFVKRGGQWITAEEMARTALDTLFDRLAGP
jgi:hypothetical protein